MANENKDAHQRPVEITVEDVERMKLKLYRPAGASKPIIRAAQLDSPVQIMTKHNTLEGGVTGDYVAIDAHGNLSILRQELFEQTYKPTVAKKQTQKKKTTRKPKTSAGRS